MTDNTMREAFEKWAVSEGMPITRGHYYDVYASGETRAAYLAWQAARSVPVVGEVLLYALVKDGSVRFSCESAEVLTRNKNIHGYELVPLHAKPPTSITQAELERLEKDAERYRFALAWLLDDLHERIENGETFNPGTIAAISRGDAAMQERKP